MLNHDNYVNFIRGNYELVRHFGYTMQDVENMLPFEREIFLEMGRAEMEEENQEKERLLGH